MIARGAILFCGALLSGALGARVAPAYADENNDLDLIPHAIEENAPSPAAGASAASHGKYYVEDAFGITSRRGGLVVPQPPPPPANWRNRTSLDATDQWHLANDLTLAFSDRFNLREENDYDFPSRQIVRNDFREGYLTWQPIAQDYLEAGRINLRNGVALGFNPTDFFKTRTAVDQSSLDPSTVREDRLGTAMLRGEGIWNGAAASIAYAPKFYAPTRVVPGSQPGISPMLDRTNAAHRVLLSASYDIADLSPQALLYHESDETRLGLNLSHPIGQSIVAYAEWAGGRQRNLIEEAISYGKKTGTLPQTAPVIPPTDTSKSFRQDFALGGSWTSAEKITVNLEYHYHQAGFSGSDLRRWFAIGGAQARVPNVTSELWYIRGYANDQQEPLARQQVFLRADWNDAIVPDLELAALTFVNLYDGSTLSQLSANYYLSSAWTISGYINANLGRPRSERGSFAQAGSAILQLTRYF